GIRRARSPLPRGLVPRTRSSHGFAARFVCELRVQKRHKNHRFASVLRFRSSLRSEPQDRANFGIGTLAMDAWWQCEIPYPFVPQAVLDAADSVRASLPNRYCDPKVAADLFAEVIDEFLLCDELGMNVL